MSDGSHLEFRCVELFLGKYGMLLLQVLIFNINEGLIASDAMDNFTARFSEPDVKCPR